MANTIKLKRSTTTGSIPTAAALSPGEIALNVTDGKAFMYRGTATPSVVQLNPVSHYVGAQWQDVTGFAPIRSYDYDDLVLNFVYGASHAVTMYIRVPQAYLTGSQILLKFGIYSASVTNFVKMQTTSYLIRKNTDSVSSSTNSYTSTNGDQALPSTTQQYLEQSLDLTSSTGTVNGVVVNPGDLLKIVLKRVAPTGTEDQNNNLCMLPATTEVIFS